MSRVTVANVSGNYSFNVTDEESRPEEEFAFWSNIPWVLTIFFSALAIVLNSLLLVTLHKTRPKERSAGMVILTILEILLNFVAEAQIIYYKYGKADNMIFLQVYHCLQTLKNYWLLAMAVCRMLIIIKPLLVSSKQVFNFKQQLTTLCFFLLFIILPLCVSTTFKSSSVIEGNSSNGTDQIISVRETIDHFCHFFISFMSVGVIFPGLVILITSICIAYSLKVRFFQHKSTKRTTKIIFLLTLGFILFEFPFAIVMQWAAVLALQFDMEDIKLIQHKFSLMEQVAQWSGVFVPLDSCMNFMILFRYSRSMQYYIRKKTGIRLPFANGRTTRDTPIGLPMSTRRRQRLYMMKDKQIMYGVRRLTPEENYGSS